MLLTALNLNYILQLISLQGVPHFPYSPPTDVYNQLVHVQALFQETAGLSPQAVLQLLHMGKEGGLLSDD